MAPILHLLPDIGPHQTLIYISVASLVVLGVYNFFFRLQYPASLPRAGEPPGKTSFSWRTIWLYYTDCQTLFRQAYEEYGKNGKTVLLPGLGFRNEVILPPSAMRWLFSQSEDVLSPAKGILEVDQPRYSLGHDKYLEDPWQGMLVKTEMNAVLENICEALNDELGIAFDTYFGADTEWKEIDLYDTVRMVIAQAASRFTVGLPLCRNQTYLKENLSLFDQFVLNAGLAGGSPKFLRPIVGRLASSLTPYGFRKVRKHFDPLLKERMEFLKEPRHENPKEPNDHLQMMLRYAQKERPTELVDINIMTRRLVISNFGSMHQTGIQVTNLILNILGSDDEFNTISALRDEVSRIIESDDKLGAPGQWNKAKVARMVRCDSVARETLRLNSFGNRAVIRKVMADGVVTEDGIKLPKGSILSFLGHPAQVDGDLFEDPLKYDPFRFSRLREAAADVEGRPGANNFSFVSTSPNHLPFGHGKHACPGRFLIDFELKMVIAYLLNNYDMEFPAAYKGQRPQNVWVTEAILPPPGARIRIRRKTKDI